MRDNEITGEQLRRKYQMSKVILKSRTFLILIILVKLFFVGTVPIKGQMPTKAFGELAKMAKAYNIEIVTTDLNFPVKTSYGAIDGKQADRRHLENYISLFVSEFTFTL